MALVSLEKVDLDYPIRPHRRLTLKDMVLRGLFRHSCRSGECCRTFWEDLSRRVPPGVGYVSIYSRSDGIVQWRACLDEGARLVEIDSSHCGMSVHPDAYRVIAGALAEFRGAARRPARRSAEPKQPLRRAA